MESSPLFPLMCLAVAGWAFWCSRDDAGLEEGARQRVRLTRWLRRGREPRISEAQLVPASRVLCIVIGAFNVLVALAWTVRWLAGTLVSA